MAEMKDAVPPKKKKKKELDKCSLKAGKTILGTIKLMSWRLALSHVCMT